MANEKRLIYLEDAIEKIVNFPSKVAHDNFYGKKQFTPMQMLTIIADRQHEIIDLLKNVKEVDAVEVVHGRWEKHGKHDWRCTVCKIAVPYSYTGFHYCPNCGARIASIVSSMKDGKIMDATMDTD